MTTYISNRNSDGLTDENGHFRFPMKLVEGQILSGFEPSATGGMSISISAGEARVPYADYSHGVWSDEATSVTIGTSSTVNPRIDRVVGYVDRQMEMTSEDVNNPDMFKFAVVQGTPSATPVAPNDNTVQSAVQAGNPWIEICRVTVPRSATSITSGNIDTSYRVGVSISPNIKLPEISLADGTRVKFAVISQGDPLPAAEEGVTIIVLKTKS